MTIPINYFAHFFNIMEFTLSAMNKNKVKRFFRIQFYGAKTYKKAFLFFFSYNFSSKCLSFKSSSGVLAIIAG